MSDKLVKLRAIAFAVIAQHAQIALIAVLPTKAKASFIMLAGETVFLRVAGIVGQRKI